MSMFQVLAAAATMIGVVGLVLLIVRLTAARNAPARHHGPVMPAQRSPLTQAELVKLNQAYGAGQVGEAEYQRRRKELLARVD